MNYAVSVADRRPAALGCVPSRALALWPLKSEAHADGRRAVGNAGGRLSAFEDASGSEVSDSREGIE